MRALKLLEKTANERGDGFGKVDFVFGIAHKYRKFPRGTQPHQPPAENGPTPGRRYQDSPIIVPMIQLERRLRRLVVLVRVLDEGRDVGGERPGRGAGRRRRAR